MMPLTTSDVCGQTLRYRPVVGQELEYGVEFRLICQDAREPEVRRRCRVRYRMIALTDEHWEAEFTTHPFTATGPYSGPEAVERLMGMLSQEVTPVPGPSLAPPDIQARFDSMAKWAARQRKAQVTDMKVYPGLFLFCSGRMKANFQGELLATTSNTNMPMLVGQLAGLPLCRLSDKDASAPFGYKDYRKVNLLRKGDEESDPVATSVFLLQTVKPKTSNDPNVAAFDLECEIAGGANVGANIRVSGTGYSEFSINDSMPIGGNTDYEVSGVTFAGRGNSYLVRVSFQRLDPWRRTLFDAMLLPTATALDRENLPRLTPEQLSGLRTAFGKARSRTGPDIVSMLFYNAPPPYDSAIHETIEEIASRDLDDGAVPDESSRDRRDREEMINQARSLRTRWKQMWKAATVVEREWSDTSGSFKIAARMLGRTETDVALQRIDNGQRIYVPLERLGKIDQEIAETFALSPEALRGL
ncbi:hypothetical protein Pla100_59300 [Neorhodopirellula pilleata]|uniref:SLA1 homology domain-containing protein n=2 Tax=Neorhodopirellula pilleata TaxID=2714738 RepID=A0A5C5ZK63_9BACT|nr:hypothetical protein Pla100_59300 [Neorhodopirellula pilleata]